jgi:hypothetical protein
MAYIIKISGGTELKIDREEMKTVIEGVEAGSRLVKVKSGMFNPSFISAIEPDYKRLEGLDALDKLPDMFERIGNMASIEDIIAERLEAPKEPEKDLGKIREMLDRNKPDFLKNKNTDK